MKLVLVPFEPTDAMYGAGGVEQFKTDMACTPVREALKAVYQAMLAAAPPAEEQSDGLVAELLDAIGSWSVSGAFHVVGVQRLSDVARRAGEAITTLNARLTATEAEAELRRKAEANLLIIIRNLRSNVTALKADVERKDKALEPFAALANGYDGIPPTKYFGDTDFELRYPGDKLIQVLLKDLRRARAAFQPKEGE